MSQEKNKKREALAHRNGHLGSNLKWNFSYTSCGVRKAIKLRTTRTNIITSLIIKLQQTILRTHQPPKPHTGQII